MKEIKIFKLENYYMAKISELEESYIKFVNKYAKTSAGSSVLLESTLIIFFIFYFSYSSNKLTTEKAIELISYLILLIFPLREIADYLLSIREMLPSIKYINDVIEYKGKIEEKVKWQLNTGFKEKRLEINCISLKFKSKIILKDTRIKFYQGINFVSGDNGSGKTLLMELIAGIYKDGEAEINFCLDLPLDSKFTILMAGQNPYIFDGYAIDNLNMLDPDYSQRFANIVSEMNFDINLMSSIVKKSSTNGGSNFSTGEKQLINLLRALSLNPEILIIDESLANLASDVSEKVMSYIVNYRKEKINIIICHQVPNFQFNNHFIIKNGKVSTSNFIV